MGMSLKGLWLLWRLYGYPPGHLLMAFSFRTVGCHLGPEAEAFICAVGALGYAYTLDSLLDSSSLSGLGRPGLSKPGGGTSGVTVNLPELSCFSSILLLHIL